jgi:hypothetical protein
MKHMRRIVSVLPVENLAVYQIIYSFSNQIVVSRICKELLFLVLPQFNVFLDFKPFCLGVAVLLLRIQDYIVNWIVELTLAILPFKRIRANLEQVHEKIAHVVVVSGLLGLKTSHS